MASFDTGAIRNDDQEKHDPDGFLSPFALESYFKYMTKHRRQHDGTLRASDNWQLGIPMTRYMKSLWRHFFDVWKISRGGTAIDPDNGEKVDLETALNGVLFNTFGLLHETTKGSNRFKLESKTSEEVYKEARISPSFGSCVK